MEELIKAAQALLTYTKWGSIFDVVSTHNNCSQSRGLQRLLKNLEKATPNDNTIKLVKEEFTTLMQTAIIKRQP